jgi:STE24 endopeptidase
MNWKLFVLLLVVLEHGYRLVLNFVQRKSAANPIPANVADVYDAETYTRWRNYHAEHCGHSMISTAVSFAVTLALLLTDAYAAVANWFPADGFMQLLAVVLTNTIVYAVVNVGLVYYSTMVIEQKYGFNRTTVKTFIIDQIRNLLLEILLSLGLAWVLMLLHQAMGDWVIVLFAAVMFGFTLLISFLYPFFSRIGNKFVPLEDGELKEKLTALLTKHNYTVRAIEVMDASRRTTKLNAYFTGFGKLKTIVLYDNMLTAMTTDEIVAVFAHELGHGLHKDVLKMQILNIGNMLLMGIVVWLSVKVVDMHTTFGFDGINYGFAMILAGCGLGVVQPLTGIVTNAHSRKAEYRADRQAVVEGYGEALCSGLKKLGKENFSHLAPAKLLVVLDYSHPPLSERIEAVEQAMKH